MAEQVTRSLKMAGEWWLPEKYEGKKLGTLEWMPHYGCQLTLIDETSKFEWGDSLDIILGMNSDQEPVTLIDCRSSGGWGSALRGNVMSYTHKIRVRCALVGRLFETDTDIALSNLYAGYAGVDQYVSAEYYEIEDRQDSEGKSTFGPITFNIPTYEMAEIGDVKAGLFVGWSLERELQLTHTIHFSFPKGYHCSSVGNSFGLVHESVPAFLSALMGHQSFLTSLTGRIERSSIAIFDGYHERNSWDGNPRLSDRLVHGWEETISHWPAALPAWVKNYDAVANLCSAYVKILTDDEDGFFNINNLVHLFFGIERYHKTKCRPPKSSLENALIFSVNRISEYFANVGKFTRAASEVDVNSLVRARQVLVHANEEEPDYRLVFQQVIFITRCVFLLEMEYPVAEVQQDTQHWDLWQFFADRRKQNKAENNN